MSQHIAEEIDTETHLENLKSAIDLGNQQDVVLQLNSGNLDDQVWCLSQLSKEELEKLFPMLPIDQASRAIKLLPEAISADALELLQPEMAANILADLDIEERISLIDELGDENAEAIIAEVSQTDVENINYALSYPEDQVGHQTDREFLAFQKNATIGSVLDNLREKADEYSDLEIQYSYVVDSNQKLVGVLNLRSLLMRKPEVRLSDVMIPNPISIHAHSTLKDAAQMFLDKQWLAAPVVDGDGMLVGIIKKSTISTYEAEQDQRTVMRLSGIKSGEEFRSMPFRQRVTGRISWLSVNVCLNVVAASIIAANQDVLAQVIALAVFLPIISDMSGCSGNQAVAVSLRELSVGVIRPGQIAYVVSKEAAVGVFNGVCLGLLLGGIAWLWQGNFSLGLVVGSALAINTAVACAVGGVVPLILKKLDKDPALASGPLLTTVTDMCGFLLVLTMAGAALPYLVS